MVHRAMALDMVLEQDTEEVVTTADIVQEELYAQDWLWVGQPLQEVSLEVDLEEEENEKLANPYKLQKETTKC